MNSKKIEIVGVNSNNIEVVDRPKQRIEPENLAAALGANQIVEKTVGKLGLIDLMEIGTQLLHVP